MTKKSRPRTEIELKLSMSPEAMARLRRSSALRDCASSPLVRKKLLSVYFDTPKHDLFASGISLRVRRTGKQHIRTIKIGTAIEAGLSQPREHEQAVARIDPALDSIDDDELRDVLMRRIDGQTVAPVFETVITRSTCNLEAPDASLIELALDNGAVIAGEHRTEFSEAELELKQGAPHALLTIAETLLDRVPFTASTLSKAQRGYALLASAEQASSGSGPVAETSQSRSKLKPKLEGTMNVSEALREIGRAAASQILTHLDGTLSHTDPEMPHQLRVGLRRLRTALRVLAPLSATTDMRILARDAQKFGRITGRLRDADVLIDDIFEPAAAATLTPAARKAVLKSLEGHREAERTAVRAALSDPRWNRLRLNCMLFDFAVDRASNAAGRKTADAPILPAARLALQKSWKKARSWGQRIDDLTVEERHELRKALKGLRYATEFFLPLYPAASGAPEFLKRLKQLQDVFGYLNDVALSASLTGIVAQETGSSKRLETAAAEIQAWHQERADKAWEDAQQRWGDLKACGRFWR